MKNHEWRERNEIRTNGYEPLHWAPGLRYREEGRTLCVLISDPAHRNALRRAALDSIYETCTRFHELPFHGLLIEFDTRATSVACAGLNLDDFEESARQLAPGEDMLAPNHYFVRATHALRMLSKSVPTAAIVGGHLVGAGVELALSCSEVSCTRPDSKVLLPHLRIGVPYHTAGLCHMARIMGWEALSQAMVTDAIPMLFERVLGNRARVESLSTAERVEEAKIAIARMAAVYDGLPVRIGGVLYRVEDRTGKTRHIAESHMLQIMSHVLFGGDVGEVPRAMREVIDTPRIRASTCLENKVTNAIAAHRKRPKELNQHFSRSVGAPLGSPFDSSAAPAGSRGRDA